MTAAGLAKETEHPVLDAASLERAHWRIIFPGDDPGLSEPTREAILARAMEIAAGGGGPAFRRSRHAATWLASMSCGGAGERLEVFIKLLDRPRGIAAVKAMLRGPRATSVLAVTGELKRAGFGAPEILMLGLEHRAAGRGLICTARVAGTALPNFLGGRPSLERRRTLLRELGAEIARLHHAGFIHGDLTPYNVFVSHAAPPDFVFIDHERTRRVRGAARGRSPLRNFVQLGRFDLPGLTRSDRMRVFCGYSRALSPQVRRRTRAQVARMLVARIARDSKASFAARSAMLVKRGGAGDG